jgi:hypothetical protein
MGIVFVVVVVVVAALGVRWRCVQSTWDFHRREEAHVSGVSVRGSGGLCGSGTEDGCGGGDGGEGVGEDHPCTCTDPQQVFADEERRDTETCRLVLTDDGVRSSEHLVYSRGDIDIVEVVVCCCMVEFDNGTAL